MPTVPQYAQSQVKEGRLNAPQMSGEIPLDTSGAEIGHALGRLGGAVYDAYKKQQDEADKSAAADADFELGKLENEVRTTALSAHGENAITAQDKATKAWNTGLDAIEKKYDNERVKQLLKPKAQSRELQLDSSLQSHVAGEMYRNTNEKRESIITLEQNAIAQTPLDHEGNAERIRRIKNTAIEDADFRGLAGPAKELHVKEKLSQTHAMTINQILAQDIDNSDEKALEYYNAVKASGTLLQKEDEHLIKTIETARITGQANRNVNALVGKYGEDQAGAVSHAERITDPKTKKETLEQLDNHYRREKRARDAENERKEIDIANTIDETGDFTKVPAKIRSTLPLDKRAAYQAYAKKKAGGEYIATDTATYYNLKTQAATPELRDKFLKTNLADPDLLNKLNPAERKKLIDLQTGMRKGDGKALKEAGHLQSKMQVVNGVLGELKIDPTPKPETEKGQYVAGFHKAVDQKYDEYVSQHNRQPTHDEIRSMASKVAIEVPYMKKYLGGAFGMMSKKPSFQIEVQDIPEQSRTEIIQALSKKGMPTTDEDVKRLYLRHMTSKRPGEMTPTVLDEDEDTQAAGAIGVPSAAGNPYLDLLNEDETPDQPGATMPEMPTDATPEAAPVPVTPKQAPPSQTSESAEPNPYLALIDEDHEDEKTAVQESMYAGASKDPDRHAEIRRLSDKLNLPTTIVEANYEELRERQRRDAHDIDGMVKDTPVTSKWIQDPDNAAIAHDDLDNLTFFEKYIKQKDMAWGKGNRENRHSELWADRLRETLETGNYSARHEAEIKQLDEELKPYQEYAEKMTKEGGHYFYQFTSQLPNMTRGIFKGGAGKEEAEFGVIAKKMIEGAGIGAAGGAAAGALFGGVGAVPGAIAGVGLGIEAGGITGAFESAYQMEAGSAFSEYVGLKDKYGNTIEPRKAAEAADLVGKINGSLEASGEILQVLTFGAPIGKMAGKATVAAIQKIGIPGAAKIAAVIGASPAVFENMTVGRAVKEAAKRMALGTFGEVVTEVTQEYVTGVGGEKVSGTEFGDITSERHAELRQKAYGVIRPTLEATLFSGGIGGSFHIANTAIDVRRANQAKQLYEAIGEQVAKSKTRARHADSHGTLVEGVTEGTHLQNVFFNAEAFDTYFQSKGLNAKQAAEELGVADEYANAKDQGRDLKIPLSVWTNKAVHTEHFQGLADDVKWREQDPSPRQATAQTKKTEADVTQAYEAAKSQVADKASFAEGVKTVSDQMYEQLLAHPATEIAPKAMKDWQKAQRANADLYARKVAVRAKNRGISVEQSHEEMRPDIVTEARPYAARVMSGLRKEIAASEAAEINGVTKEAVLGAIDKYAAGGKLEPKQNEMIAGLYQGALARRPEEKIAAQEAPLLQRAMTQDLTPMTPGLDMRPLARRARAAGMGFDTSTTWYHGTNKKIQAFEGRLGKAIWFSDNPNQASEHAEFASEVDLIRGVHKVDFAKDAELEKQVKVLQAKARQATNAVDRQKLEAQIDEAEKARNDLRYQGQNVLPTFLKAQNPLVHDAQGRALDEAEISRIIEQAKSAGHDSVNFQNIIDSPQGGMETPSNVMAVFSPNQIRSVNAVFDPANAASANILYQAPNETAITQDLTPITPGLDMKPKARNKRKREWAKKSKLNDSRGNPKLFYHGTKADIEAFDLNALGASTGAGSARLGIFFASDASTASDYAELAPGRGVLRGKAEANRVMAQVDEFRSAMIEKYGPTKMNFGEGPIERWEDKATAEELNKYNDLLAEYDSFTENVLDESLNDPKKQIHGLEQELENLKRNSPQQLREAKDQWEASIESVKKKLSGEIVEKHPPPNAAEYYAKNLNKYQNYLAQAEDALRPEALAEREARITELEKKISQIKEIAELGDTLHANVIPVYLKAENPYIHDFKGESYRDVSYREIMEKALAEGHDSVIFKNTYDPADRENRVKQDIVAVFSPNQIRSVNAVFDPARAESANILFQEQGKPLGFTVFLDEAHIIGLMKESNESTFLHEMAHVWLKDAFEYARSAPPEMSEQATKDWQNLSEYLGVKEGQEKLTTDQQELFARSFEAYLREGVAPSASLKRIFRQMRQWLTRIYRAVHDLVLTPEQLEKRKQGYIIAKIGPEHMIEMSPEIKAVMDRILATEEELNAAEKKLGYTPLQDSLTDMDPKMRERLAALQGRAHEQTIETLIKQQLDELKEDNKAFIAARREEAKKKQTALINEEPVYKAQATLREALKTRKTAKLLAEEYLGKKLKNEQAGLFEVQAELLGFSSGDEMARAITSAKTFDAELKLRVDQEMIQYADMKDSGVLTEEATKAVHSMEAYEVLALEHEILAGLIEEAQTSELVKARRAAEAKVDALAAKGKARQLIWTSTTPKAGQYSPYLTAERNAAMQSAKALANKDYEAASKYKRQQLLNHSLARESIKAGKKIAVWQKFLADLRTRAKESFKREEHYYQVASILSKLGYVRADFIEDESQPDLAKWLAAVNEQTNVADIPDWMLKDKAIKNHKELTALQLQDVVKAFKNIIQVANFEKRALKLADGADMADIINRLKQAAEEGMRGRTPHQHRIAATKLDALKNRVNRYFVSLKRISTILTDLQGFKASGAFTDIIYKGYDEAANEKSKIMRDVQAGFKDLHDVYSKDERRDLVERRIFYPELGDSVPKIVLIQMAKNLGNETNREKLFATAPVGAKGIAWNEQVVMSLLQKNLTAKDWNYVQGIWDHLDTVRPQAFALHKRVTGFSPGKVEGVPFSVTTSDGKAIAMRGGYYPLRADPRGSSRAQMREEADQPLYTEKNPSWMAVTSQGHTKARTNADYAVSLDPTIEYRHMHDVVHDIAFREYVIDMRRLVMNDEFRNSVTVAAGPVTYDAIKEWIAAVAGSEQDVKLSPLEQALRTFRSNTTLAMLGLRVGNLLQNFTNVALYAGAMPGFTQKDVAKAMLTRGPEYWRAALYDQAKYKEIRETVFGLSSFMADKKETPDISIYQQRVEAFGDPSLLRESVIDIFGNDSALAKAHGELGDRSEEIKRFATFLMAATDEATSIPIWMEAFQKKLDEGMSEEEAVAYADGVIRNSVGSGRKGDTASIQRDKGVMSLLAMFYSFINSEYNRWSTEVGMTRVGEQSKAQLLGFIAGRLLVFNLASLLISGKGPGDEEDPYWWFLRECLLYPVNFFPGAREVATVAFDNAFGFKSFGYRASPVSAPVEAVFKTIKAGRAVVKGEGEVQALAEWMTKLMSLSTGYPDQINTWMWNGYDAVFNDMSPTVKDVMKRRPKRERGQ